MIYFYSRASVKHLGFITRFEKKEKKNNIVTHRGKYIRGSNQI